MDGKQITTVQFRSALAGCGSIAPMHAQALAALPHVQLTGLADPDLAAARRLSQSIAGQPACYADLAGLLAADKPDVVHICTPHHTHVPLAVLALQAGCHVLLEKPPAISLDGLQALSAAVGESDRTLGICFQNRFNAASQQARQILRSGLAGPILAARAMVTWKRDAAYYGQAAWRGKWATEGGGVMINQAIHTLDMLIWLAGRPLTVEGSIANRRLRDIIEVEDTAEMLMSLENGARALFYATTAYSGDAPVFLEISCANVRLRLEGDHLILLDTAGEPLESSRQADWLQKAALAAGEDPAYAAGGAGGREANGGKSCWGRGHGVLIGAYYRALAEGGHFPIDLASGSLALRTLLALYESHRQGKAVTVV